ncbi:MAG TPA: DUF5657 family protein [Patescibacteria group bacterium]|nr:DUF5657 family protein [Patescibacteria group bacterium]
MNLSLFTTTLDFALLVKIILVILIGFYTIFVFVIFNNIRSLSNLLVINRTLGSPLLRYLSIFYLLISFALFIAALVIL